MRVRHGGKPYEITRERVDEVGGAVPQEPRRYTVFIGATEYPIKQAAGKGIGLPPVAFTSQQAYRWLSKLGYEIIDANENA